jgi:flagellar FliL protein
MNTKKILLIFLLVILAIVIIIAAVYYLTEAKSGEKKLETVIIPTGGKFQTNLKDSKNIILLNYQIEVQDDKKLLALIDERCTEVRSRVLDILRDKTMEEVDGTQGKVNLETEILQYYRSLFGREEIIDVFIDDLVVQ